MANDSLKALHTALIDAQEGYRKAAEEADDGELVAIFRETVAIHGRAHAEIHKILRERGEEPDDYGSFMGTVHKAVIATRAAVTGLDKSSLSSFASGEERILEKYDDAIAEQSDEASSVLRAQKEALRAIIARMKQMAVSEATAA